VVPGGIKMMLSQATLPRTGDLALNAVVGLAVDDGLNKSSMLSPMIVRAGVVH
jgi:hypothetical protein